MVRFTLLFYFRFWTSDACMTYKLLHHKGLTVFDFASARTQITGFFTLDHLPRNFFVTFLIKEKNFGVCWCWNRAIDLQVMFAIVYWQQSVTTCAIDAIWGAQKLPHDLFDLVYFHFANIADLNWKVFVTQRKPIKDLHVFEITSYFLSKYTENKLNKKERCLQISPEHCSEFTFFTFIIFMLSHGWYRWR